MLQAAVMCGVCENVPQNLLLIDFKSSIHKLQAWYSCGLTHIYMKNEKFDAKGCGCKNDIHMFDNCCKVSQFLAPSPLNL